MQVQSASNVNFSSRVKYSKRMSRFEKFCAEDLLNYRFNDINKTNKQLLREYGICLSFDKGSDFPPTIRFKPGFYVLQKGFDYKKIDTMMGEQTLFLSTMESGAKYLRTCLEDAYKVKQENLDKNPFSTVFGYIKNIFKPENG